MAGNGIPEGMDLPTFFAMLTPEEKTMFYQGPAMASPDGSLPDFDNPPNQNALGYGLLITGAVLSTLAVGVRLYPRLFMGKTISMQLSDYLVVAAWAIFGAYMYYIYSIVISPGIFVHQWNVRYIDFVHLLYKVSAGSSVYGPIICLTKVAILLDWLHIFVPHRTHNLLAWIIYVVIALNCLYYTAGTLEQIFACTPRRRIWDRTVPGRCNNSDIGNIVAAVFNVVSDLVIIALPQKVIWGLRMSRGRRAGISALFAIGVFACICAAARLVYSVRLMKSEDITYSVSPTGLWSLGEMTSGFLIAGVPSLPRIFKERSWTKALFTWIRSISGGSHKGSRENTARGLPSWYKKGPSVKIRQEDMYTELDEHVLVETSTRDREGATISNGSLSSTSRRS